MDLSVLQTFLDVVRRGSFAAVARDRNVDPSAVSRAIANLENELGVRLFQRTTRRLSLTEAGTVFHRRTEPLMEDISGAISAAREISNQPIGTLRITASVSFGLACIVPHLPSFEAQYRDLAVDLVLTDLVLDLVRERIDVAIRLGKMADSTLIAHRLMSTHYTVCASPDYLERNERIQHPQELGEHKCLCFPLEGFRSRWLFRDQTGTVETVTVQGQIVISNAIALLNCTLSGMGISLLPNWLIRDDLATGKLIDVFPNHAVTATDFETAAWFVYPSRRYLPLNVKVFTDFLRQKLL